MFSMPCTVNGMAPSLTASRNRWMHGSPAGSVDRRGHSTISASSSVSRASTTGSALGGTNTRRGHAIAAANVEAANAALPHDAMANGGRSTVPLHGERPNDSAVLRCSRIGEEVPRLVAAGNLPGLVLDPYATIHAESERVTEGVRSTERSHMEPGPRDRGNLGIELRHECSAGGLRHAVSRGKAVPSKKWPEGNERVPVVGPAQCGDALHQLQRVMSVRLAGVRTSPDQRLGDVDMLAAHRTRPTRREWPLHSVSPTPRRR